MTRIKTYNFLHQSTKDYIERMMNDKVFAMKIAKKYGKQLGWTAKFGYGGFKYIPGRLTPLQIK